MVKGGQDEDSVHPHSVQVWKMSKTGDTSPVIGFERQKKHVNDEKRSS